jgi:uncharacterized membrane protein YgcG
MRGVVRLSAAILLLVASVAPAGAVERILRFVSDVAVERNGDLIVDETILVEAEGREIRRGILRDFPTTYTRRDGARVDVGFDVERVTRDGSNESWETERMSNGVRLRIGSADRMLAHGRHEYVIRYRTTRQIGFFPDFDELYWNATGTGWTFAIEQAEARIRLPQAVPFRQSAFYTGPQGARGQAAAVVEQRDGRIVFRTTASLPPRNGLTVAAAWQKGVVTPPDAAQQIGWLLSDNLALGIAAVGLPLVIGFYLLAWMLVGRDPPRGTIIPLFGPPAGMSAAGVRYVDRMGFDNRAFAAALIELGVNGHIKLIDQGKTTLVERRSGGKPIGRAEQALETKLLGSSPSVPLTQDNHERIGKARDSLKEALDASYKNKLFRNNFGWSGLGLAAAVGVVVAVVLGVWLTYGSDHAGGAIAGMLIPIIPVIFGANLIRSGWRKYHGGWLLQFLGMFIALIGVAAGLAIMYANSRGVMEVLPGLAPAVLAAFAGLSFHWLKAPSVEGRRIMDQIDGFREYLGVAEEERLEFLHPPEKTPELFERFLPFAIALDLENTWAKRFAGILATAAAGAAAYSWYEGSRNIASDPVSFTDHIGSELSNTIASAASPPGSTDSSGGSSGGGSSGGGGGGGGGSGW